MLAKSIAISGMAAIANAHILMTNPVPYGKSSLTNGPLDASGSDFPCKQRSGVYNAEGASNVYAQGSKQSLEFKGTAVHGGGSCQVSITTDANPTKSSVWKVIKSIEGGCPAKGQSGNLPGNNAEAPVPYKYDFTIPQELAAGNYTLAWTWFNRIGNREMYMNCAPMAVTGSGGDKAFMDGLPDMMVANIGNGCSTPDSKDIQFPSPGKDVDKFNGQTDAFAAPVGSCGKTGAGGAPTSGGGGGSASTSAAGSTPASAGSSAPTSAAGGGSAPAPPAGSGSAPTSAGGSLPGGVFVTSGGSAPAPTQAPGAGSPSAPAAAPSSPAAAPSAPAAPPSAPAAAPSPPAAGPSAPAASPGGAAPSGGAGSGGGHAAGSACSPEGQWNCIDGKSFQRCAGGKWSATQAMAAGVSCTTGESADLKMAAAAASRRGMRHALRMRA